MQNLQTPNLQDNTSLFSILQLHLNSPAVDQN